jgi:hypothetical protein
MIDLISLELGCIPRLDRARCRDPVFRLGAEVESIPTRKDARCPNKSPSTRDIGPGLLLRGKTTNHRRLAQVFADPGTCASPTRSRHNASLCGNAEHSPTCLLFVARRWASTPTLDEGMQVSTCQLHESNHGERRYNLVANGCGLCLVAASCAPHERRNSLNYNALHGEVARVELRGEISEFHALNLRAILAIMEGSEFASDYLEMAESVASSDRERTIVASTRTACERIRAHRSTVTECLPPTIG